MVAIRKDLTADSGAAFSVALQYFDSNNAEVNLSGFTSTLSVIDDRDNSIQALDGGGTSDGWMRFDASGSDTALWSLGRQKYCIDLENPSGDVDRLIFGNLNVRHTGVSHV